MNLSEILFNAFLLAASSAMALMSAAMLKLIMVSVP